MENYRFHWKISEENKERLTKPTEIIRIALENEGFINARVSNSRRIDPPDTPINLIALGFIKEDVQYRISIEIMESKN